MSRRFWVTSSLVRRPLIICWVFRGRTPRSERLLVGQTDVSEAKRSTSASRALQNSSISRPGFCFTAVFGPGTRGTADRATGTARRNSRSRGSRISAGTTGRPCSRAACQARIRPRSALLGLLRPAGAGIGLGAVLKIPDEMRCTGLVPREGCPGLAPVPLVAVRDDDPGEELQDTALLHGDAAIKARISATGSFTSPAAFARQECTNPADTTPPVRSLKIGRASCRERV